eukprot:TRINITY_DN6609_c0_g1_i1.p1 TRINITY_DN6609_c0_g1~~TRINITY_DN6609_c0_g1_i1.p1  ORF type:complete len:371 (-),score=91.16 TRINITY_DN6609_c0_g1_i1:27-1139(-)
MKKPATKRKREDPVSAEIEEEAPAEKPAKKAKRKKSAKTGETKPNKASKGKDKDAAAEPAQPPKPAEKKKKMKKKKLPKDLPEVDYHDTEIFIRECPDDPDRERVIRKYYREKLRTEAVEGFTWICKERTKKFLGHGFIRFHSTSLAGQALQLPAPVIAGKHTQVVAKVDRQQRPVEQVRTVVVSNCPAGTNEADLRRELPTLERVRFKPNNTAHVIFPSEVLARRAAAGRFVTLRNVRCDVEMIGTRAYFARRTVFVSRCPKTATQDELFRIFSNAERFKWQKKTRKDVMSGLVVFPTAREADLFATRSFVFVQGKKVFLRKARAHSRKKPREGEATTAEEDAEADAEKYDADAHLDAMLDEISDIDDE